MHGGESRPTHHQGLSTLPAVRAYQCSRRNSASAMHGGVVGVCSGELDPGLRPAHRMVHPHSHVGTQRDPRPLERNQSAGNRADGSDPAWATVSGLDGATSTVLESVRGGVALGLFGGHADGCAGRPSGLHHLAGLAPDVESTPSGESTPCRSRHQPGDSARVGCACVCCFTRDPRIRSRPARPRPRHADSLVWTAPTGPASVGGLC